MFNRVGQGNDLKGLAARSATMDPKGEPGKWARTLSAMPKGHRLIAPGGHADGLSAGVLGGAVIKINRRRALILPAVLERVVPRLSW
jgi:hypothetical protein